VSDAFRPTQEAPEELDDRERTLFQRLRSDFAFYAPRALKIRGKAPGFIPFRLSSAQMLLHREIEKMRAEKGLVRIIVLKGRQQGISTYVQGRFFWRITHGEGLRAFILTHLDTTTDNLYGMVENFYRFCPPELKPALGASNAKEFSFKNLGSGYKVATAGNKGAGVGDTLQLFHGSELSKWPNAQSHISGALQAVPYAPGTEVILESTSDGPTGMFYSLCTAAKMGKGAYRLVFIPWYLQTEYTLEPDPDFTMSGEEQAIAEEFGLNAGQVAWRRSKLEELGSLQAFNQQYPATYDDAWKVEAQNALWKRDRLDACRVAQVPELQRIVVAVDPSGGVGKRSDECGIIVAGLGYDKRGYVLHDATGKYSPAEWGLKAVALYERYKADRIIGERNFGGDMIEANIRAVNPRVPYKDVVASRGKQQRAEPVAALYEQGQVSHHGMLAALENELLTWEPGSSRSPNRLDACLAVGTLVSTRRGEVPIEEVSVGDEVLTRRGFKRVLATRMTSPAAEVRRVETDCGWFLATGDHRVFTEDSGWVEVDALVWGHTLASCKTPSHQKSSSSTDLSSGGSQTRSSVPIASTTPHMREDAAYRGAATSTLRCGKRQTVWVKFLKDVLSTTETRTLSTTHPTIWNASAARSTGKYTLTNCGPQSGLSIWPVSALWRQNGTLRRKASLGTESTGELRGKVESLVRWFARLAAQGLRPAMLAHAHGSAQQHVRGGSRTRPTDTTCRSPAPSVPSHSGRTSTRGAPSLVPASVLGVFAVSERVPVYDLMVEGEHEFFANGLLVHNCVWALTELMLGEKIGYDTTLGWVGKSDDGEGEASSHSWMFGL
jgi:hypothetical protein